MSTLKKQTVKLSIVKKPPIQHSIISTKKQTNNEIRYHQTIGTHDADPWKRDRMYPSAALADLKRHAPTPRSDAFLPTWRTCVRCGKWSYNHFWEGALWPNGHPSGRKRRQQGKSVTFGFWDVNSVILHNRT